MFPKGRPIHPYDMAVLLNLYYASAHNANVIQLPVYAVCILGMHNQHMI